MLHAKTEKELNAKLAALDLSVLRRSKGRKKRQVERSHAAHLLSTLPSQRLSFPLTLEHRDRPDFLLTMGKCSIGIEHTEAVPQNEAHASVLRDKLPCTHDVYFISRVVPGEQKKPSKQLIEEICGDKPGPPWEGDSVEREWAEAMAYFAVNKLNKAKAQGFQKFERNWLLIYDNWPLPMVDVSKASKTLSKLDSMRDVMTEFDSIFVMNDIKLWELSQRKNFVYDIIDPGSNS